MDLNFDFILDIPIEWALLVVVSAIIVNVAFGIFRALKLQEFNIRKLPQFLADHMLPYVGGLLLLAVVAKYIGSPFDYIFYTTVVALLAKYYAEIKDKINDVYDKDIYNNIERSSN